jgi:hypothetical protein
MASDKDQLLAMGFASERVEWALRATGNRGLQPAMDHLFENEGKPVPSDMNAVQESAPPPRSGGDDIDPDDEEAIRAASGSAAAPGEAKSIKCSQCGKIFKNVDLANFHAEKSGHDQFEESTEEIKPLTEEEKKAKLAELRQKMTEKRAKKAEADAEDAKKNEAIRRKGGQDLTKIKAELEAKEAQKQAEQKKREKADDAKAKAAIKAQIEADKRARAEKAAKEKAEREGKVYESQASTSTSAPAAAAVAASAVKGSDYKDTRLQIRLASGGQPLVTTLPSTSTLQDVAEFVAAQTLTVSVDTVNFSTTFPKKAFTRADFSKTLRDLGLTPSAVLMAS